MEEAQEDVMGCKDYMQIMKGKRTKRQKLQSPLPLAVVPVSSCSSLAESGGGDHGERFSDNNSGVIGGFDRPTTSVEEFTTSTEEEEDMANCLILLAHGKSSAGRQYQPSTANHNTTTSTKPVREGLYVYECKTCSRCFPSFQALGGHRASHKKPKVNTNEERKGLMLMEEEDDHFGNMSTALSLQIANRVTNLCANNNSKANKVHECSICGAEFSSGQALGGHMRRHRAFLSTTATAGLSTINNDHSPEARKRQRNILQLDLNLPAPEVDHERRGGESKFGFASKEKVIVFSRPSLVDCHY